MCQEFVCEFMGPQFTEGQEFTNTSSGVQVAAIRSQDSRQSRAGRSIRSEFQRAKALRTFA